MRLGGIGRLVGRRDDDDRYPVRLCYIPDFFDARLYYNVQFVDGFVLLLSFAFVSAFAVALLVV
jgi:hypothetical protein